VETAQYVTVPPGTGKSHLAQAIGFAVIQQGHRVLYREAHVLLDELAEAQLSGTRKDYLTAVTSVPLLIIDDLGMRKLPHTAAEDLLEMLRQQLRDELAITTAAETMLVDLALLSYYHALRVEGWTGNLGPAAK
jgi:DNA replication protein DnaC